MTKEQEALREAQRALKGILALAPFDTFTPGATRDDQYRALGLRLKTAQNIAQSAINIVEEAIR